MPRVPPNTPRRGVFALGAPCRRRRQSRFAGCLLVLVMAMLAGTATAGAAEAGPVAAEPVDPLTGDRLERAALLALPSVYRLDVTIEVPALRRANGRRVEIDPAARRVTERGTAVAVAGGGVLVSAAHVADPDEESIAAAAYLSQLAAGNRAASAAEALAWVRRTGARPVGWRVVSRQVRPARPVTGDATAPAGLPPSFDPGRPLRVDRDADLALLRIPAAGAPFLELSGFASRDTPVVTIGFGSETGLDGPPRGALQPAVRLGALDGSGTAERVLPDQVLTEVTTDVHVGDSGGPAVDADGAVRGIVLLVRQGGGGIIQRAAAVRELMRDAGVRPGGASASGVLFRAAMERFWRLDFAAAAGGLRASARAYPEHPLAAPLAARAASLASADLRLDGSRRTQGFLLAFGVLSALGAAACALALAVAVPRRRARPGGTRAPGRPAARP